MIAFRKNFRPGLSLLEVLTAIFIMGIGMLALMTLFPAGALSMARAIREDRAAAIGANGLALAAATDLCNDANVTAAFNGGNNLIFVDPHYAKLDANYRGIPRIRPAFLPAPPPTPDTLLARFFVFQDEIKFDATGAAAPTVDRPGTYSIAYALRRPQGSVSFTEVNVLVFAQRNTDLVEGETIFTLNPIGTVGNLSITLTGNQDIRQRSWIMDITTNSPNYGDFYRVETVSNDAANNTVLGLDRPLKANVNQILHFRDVIAVIERGAIWHP
jgi:hypothetical protein